MNTIDGLTEEQAIEIVSRAETLAEEQAEDLPRRKGARPTPPSVEAGAGGAEQATAEAGDGRSQRTAKPTLDDLFGTEDAVQNDPESEEAGVEGGEEGSDDSSDEANAESEASASSESGDMRDLALAAEGSGWDEDGREVTSAPSDADQNETNQIVIEAVTSGASPHEIVANEAGGGPNVPPLPPTEPFSVDQPEGRDSEMQQP